MKLFPILAAAAALCAATPAQAQLTQKAVRVSIDGYERYYLTYGHHSTELYAPLRQELPGLGLEFRPGEGGIEVYRGAERLATWPLLQSPPLLPDGKTPAVIQVGKERYLPVRAVAALAGRQIAWDSGSTTLRIGSPGQVRTGLPLVKSPPGAPARVNTYGQPARLSPASADRALALAGARAGFGAVLESGQSLWPVGGIATAALDAGLKAAASLPPPPIRTVVRRGVPVLAFRGGLVRRELQEGLFAARDNRLAGKVICVDAGHGGHSTGALGQNGLKEKEACLAMTAELARALQECGATVIAPRMDDTYVSLDERIDYANSQGADLFISIHCNAMPVPNSVSGTETYYYTPQSLALARAIHPHVVGVVADRDGGIRRRAFAVIRRTSMPSVLLEIAYINHARDETKLSDPNFRRRVGDAIRDGVVRYFRVE